MHTYVNTTQTVSQLHIKQFRLDCGK